MDSFKTHIFFQKKNFSEKIGLSHSKKTEEEKRVEQAEPGFLEKRVRPAQPKSL